jgi:hypothetical protein
MWWCLYLAIQRVVYKLQGIRAGCYYMQRLLNHIRARETGASIIIRALSDWKESERRSNSFELPHLSHAEVATTPDRGRGHASAENALKRQSPIDAVVGLTNASDTRCR